MIDRICTWIEAKVERLTKALLSVVADVDAGWKPGSRVQMARRIISNYRGTR
jgi:hypothetical protein